MPIPDSDPRLHGKFCGRLYSWFEVDRQGDCYLCCQGWLPNRIGNILEQEFDDIWNGPEAQACRRQIHTGIWDKCNKTFCCFIPAGELPNIADHPELDYLHTGSLIATDLPTSIYFTNDRSCNLACPSCRKHKIMHTSGAEYLKSKAVNDKLIELFLSKPTDRHFGISLTGSGDPFVSKIFREMLQNINGADFPNMTIDLQTNGTMFTPKIWESMHKVHKNLRTCRISFDAGSKHTYENVTRLNGNWDVLLENCAYLDEMNIAHPNFVVDYDFVVQQDNYTEMAQFIRLVIDKFPHMHKACFTLVNDWGTWAADTYEHKAVWKESHQEHDKLLECLTDDIFDHHKVYLSGLTALRHKAKRIKHGI